MRYKLTRCSFATCIHVTPDLSLSVDDLSPSLTGSFCLICFFIAYSITSLYSFPESLTVHVCVCVCGCSMTVLTAGGASSGPSLQASLCVSHTPQSSPQPPPASLPPSPSTAEEASCLPRSLLGLSWACPPSHPHTSTASSLSFSFCICWCYCPSLCGTLLQMTSSDMQYSEDERDETLYPRHHKHHFHSHIHIFCCYLAAHLFFFFYVVFIVGNLMLAPAGFPQGAPLTTSSQLLLQSNLPTCSFSSAPHLTTSNLSHLSLLLSPVSHALTTQVDVGSRSGRSKMFHWPVASSTN